MNRAIELEGEVRVELEGRSARVRASGADVDVRFSSLRAAHELTRSLRAARPHAATRLGESGLRLRIAIGDRQVATSSEGRGSRLASFLGYPGFDVHWLALARTGLRRG